MYIIYRLAIVSLYVDMLCAFSTIRRIYNGKDDYPSTYPYVVCLKSIMYTWLIHFRLCTGTLITDTWVITAGHCIGDIKDLYIQYGNMSVNLNKTASKSEVLDIIIHPLYGKPVINNNDIALLLVKPVYMEKYASISAIDYKTLNGLAVEYAGFGRTIILDRSTKNKIKKFKDSLLKPLQIGEGVIQSCGYIEQRYVCVSPKCYVKQSSLKGDSGGPLFYDQKLIAVLAGAPVEGYPFNGIRYFTPLSAHITWLYKVISSHGN